MMRVKQSTNTIWGIYAALILIMGVAFLLRLINIEAFSFWTDEGLTPLRASYSIPQILRNDVLIQGFVTKDTHPPFFYLIIHFTRQVLGETDFAYRFPSALAGVLLVPVMYQFGRRLRGMSLGLIVAGLTAVNPLQIWYSQEARMYTLLVLLTACMSYVLWRMLSTNMWQKYGIWYLILAGLTLYTHYSAAFLIAGQSLFGIWLLWRNRQWKLLGGTAVLLLLISIPLIPFTIPRLFTGAETAYSLIAPHVIMQDAVRQFSLGLTVDYSEQLVQFLVMGTTILLVLGLVTLPSWLHRLFLLVYLFAAPIGIIILSPIKPMYLGVRHIMIGSPAFLLITAYGVVWLQTSMRKASIRWQKTGWGIAFIIAGGVLLVGSVKAINNFYHDGFYAKDNFRDLIKYIEQRSGQNDVIVYHDAVLLALHEHYQERLNLPVTAVPEYPKLASQTLDQLPQLASKYDRIWFLPDPPDDRRDPEQLTQSWLDENMQVVDQYNTFGKGAFLQVIAYTNLYTQTALLPVDAQSLDIQWPDLPLLSGIELQFSQPAKLPTLWLNLYWQGDLAPHIDQQVRFLLRDINGQEKVIEEMALVQQMEIPETDTYSAEQFTRQQYAITVPDGTTPGSYTLIIQPIEKEPRAVTNIELAGSYHWPSFIERPFNQPAITFQNGLSLIDINHPEEIRPGHTLPLTMYWQSIKLISNKNLQYQLQIFAPNGDLFYQTKGFIAPEWLENWPENMLITANTGYLFPPTTEEGYYQFHWQLLDNETNVPGQAFGQPWPTNTVTHGGVSVVPWPLETELPTNVLRSEATFEFINLYGYRQSMPEPYQIQLDLIWQAQNDLNANYFLFVHLVDSAGTIVTQTDRVPGNMLRPTGGWRKNEVITDTITLNLPPETPTGKYRLLIGFYHPENGIRLAATVGGEAQTENQVEVTAVTVP